MNMQLTDSYGRKINYLRLSVTDRCNMRCRYCMPEEGVLSRPHADILSYEELLKIARAAVGIGIEKIRITGGEPLVRRGILEFLRQLSGIEGLRHLALTTNGLKLSEMAGDLMVAGVQRLNISLDSMQKERFKEITRGGDIVQVLAGISSAIRAGFPPPKINMVVMRGVNDDELFDFAELTRKLGVSVRFIEYMPAVKEENWHTMTIPGQELLDRLAAEYSLEPVDKGSFAGPSRDFRITGAPGTIGIITAISGHFCGECNRIRVMSDGRVKGCLFSDESVDLRPMLASDDLTPLMEALQRMVTCKPKQHEISAERKAYGHTNFAMSRIGG
jgi:GTP 3',8-cyclase